MKNFYKFADKIFEINYLYNTFGIFAKDYEVKSSESSTIVDVYQENIDNWRKTHSDCDARFNDAYLETLVIQSKAAEILAKDNKFVFHGSCIYVDSSDNSYIFTAPSGTGKSTHTRLLNEYLKDKFGYVNDDKPFISFTNNTYYVYGSPWNGKEQRGNNVKGKLKGIFIIERAKKCETIRITSKEAITLLIKQIHIPEGIENTMMGTKFIVDLCKNIPIFILRVDMSADAPKTSYEVIKELNGDK